MSIPKFTLLLIATTVILCAAYVVLLTSFDWPRPTYDILIFVVLFITTLLGYSLIVKASNWVQAYLVPLILASIVIRLLIFTLVNLMIIYTSPSDATPNVLLFFSIYFVFTLIETASLFKLLQKGPKDS